MDNELAILTINNTIKQYRDLLSKAVEKGDYGKAAYFDGYINGLEAALMYLGKYKWGTDEESVNDEIIN